MEKRIPKKMTTKKISKMNAGRLVKGCQKREERQGNRARGVPGECQGRAIECLAVTEWPLRHAAANCKTGECREGVDQSLSSTFSFTFSLFHVCCCMCVV